METSYHIENTAIDCPTAIVIYICGNGIAKENVMCNWVACDEQGCDEQIQNESFGVLLDEGGWAIVVKMGGNWIPRAPEDHFTQKKDAHHCAEQILEDLRRKGLA